MTLTPQIVFLGSYLNLEAFTLFSVMMILDAWADGLAASWNPKSCIKLAIGISLCLLGYEFGWAFIPASALLYVWSGFWQGRRTDRKDVLRKGIFILLLVLIFCGWKFIRNGILYQGDFLGLRTREWYREQYGIPELQKAVRAPRWSEGISMFEMLWKTDWVMTTFKSMFCVLGYMSFWAARWVYRGYLMIIPVAAVGLVSAIRNEKQRSAAVCGFLACVLTVLFSVYYSWSNDYEPQGRYVIYTLPVLLLCSLKGLRVLETKFLGHMGKEYPDRKIRFECILSAAVLVFVVGSLGEASFLLWKP